MGCSSGVVSLHGPCRQLRESSACRHGLCICCSFLFDESRACTHGLTRSMGLHTHFCKMRPPKECATTTGGRGKLEMRSAKSVQWLSRVPACTRVEEATG
jgi:hypothetical protein